MGYIVQSRRGRHLVEGGTGHESFFANASQVGWEPNMSKVDTVGEGRTPYGIGAALVRSTWMRCLQFSQASGPKKLKSSGSFNCSMPDPQKLPSGIHRVSPAAVALACAKSTVESAKQLSKASREI